MDYNVYLVDSFTNKAFKGNPAGVVPNAKKLSSSQMQNIARELNVSETAFITSNDRNVYKIRYFSPYEEVHFCGHSTLATFYILALKGYIQAFESGIKSFYIISGNKKLEVEIYFYNYEIDNIIIKMGTPEELGVVKDRDEFLKILNLKLEDTNLDDKFDDIAILGLGSKYAFIPIKSKDKLDNMDIDKMSLKSKLKEIDIKGVHLFFLPEEDSKIVYSRNFSLAKDLEEESATGTASGSLIYLLKKNNQISSNTITSIQGEKMGRESHIYCQIKEVDSKYRVEVGGKGKLALEGIINVN